MKFKINKKSIIEELKIVSIIANKKSKFYNTKNFTIDIQKQEQRIFIYSSNVDVVFQKYIKSEVQEGGNLSIDAQKMFEVVKEISSDEIEFEFKENQWLSIKGGKSKVKIPFLEKEEYDEIKEENLEKITTIKNDIFSKCLKKNIDFVSKDPVKPHLQGINVIFSKKKITFYSSNSYVACRYVTQDERQEKEFKFIIPSRNITEILSYLENELMVVLYFRDNFFFIKGKDSFLKVKLLEVGTQYPNLEKYFLECNTEKEFDISLNSFLKELRILKIILDEFSSVMKISLNKKKLSIESELMQTGQSKHYLECNYEGNDFSIGLNINQIDKALQNMEEFFKEIKFSFQNDRFLLLKGKEKDYKIIMMPMKINF